MNVLIVNHHGSLGKLFAVLAEHMGCKVSSAQRLYDFRSLVTTRAIDLIVCDATASEEAQEHVTRMEFISVLRNAGLKTRVFLFEQEGQEVSIDPSEAARLGSIRVFRKPVSVYEVRNALNQVQAELHKEQVAKTLKSRQESPLLSPTPENRLGTSQVLPPQKFPSA